MSQVATTVWVCTACGYICEGKTPPDSCPMCAVPGDCFVPQEETASEEDEILLDDDLLEGPETGGDGGGDSGAGSVR